MQTIKALFKKAIPWILVTVMALFVIVPYVHSFSSKENLAPGLPEKASKLIEWIDEGSQNFRTQESIELAAHAAKEKARETTRGHRYALCAEFSLVRSGKYNLSATPEDCNQYMPAAAPSASSVPEAPLL